MKPVCEIRVPTFRRASMLRRCLKSIISQTYKHWVALVLDDSPSQEGREIVNEFQDARLVYLPNERNLGCCGNLDLAFSSLPLASGGFACVLEDDNQLLPDFLEANLELVSKSGLNVVLRNQWIGYEDKNSNVTVGPETTRGNVFGNHDRILEPIDIRGSMFFSEGISNGGLFWRLGCGVNLAVGKEVVFSPLQEYCRSLQILGSVYFGAEPKAIFSLPQDGSTLREPLENRRFNRGRQSIYARLLDHHGVSLCDRAWSLANQRKAYEHLIHLACADVGRRLPQGACFGWRGVFISRFKGIAKLLLINDPLASYWKVDGESYIRSIE
jgi:glycosyltransferase involved in cell wall biosynthesis